MSLGVVIKGPEGVVLAADSRVTLQAQPRIGAQAQPITVNYDNATKLLTFDKQPYVAAVTYGAAVIGNRTAHSFLPELELALPTCKLQDGRCAQQQDCDCERITVEEFSKRLSDFYLHQWSSMMPKDYTGPPMTFVVGGFDEGAPYGSVYIIEVPRNPTPEPRSVGTDFGVTWGGQLEIAARILHGFAPQLPQLACQTLAIPPERAGELQQKLQAALSLKIPIDVLPLQDCINLADALIGTTRLFQDLAIGVRGVGGPVDLAVVTRTFGVRHISRKELHLGSG
jgi:hypothetical protein